MWSWAPHVGVSPPLPLFHVGSRHPTRRRLRRARTFATGRTPTPPAVVRHALLGPPPPTPSSAGPPHHPPPPPHPLLYLLATPVKKWCRPIAARPIPSSLLLLEQGSSTTLTPFTPYLHWVIGEPSALLDFEPLPPSPPQLGEHHL
jgi:hypothetical protein